MRRSILAVFFFFLPFTSVFSLNEYFSLSIIITLIITLLLGLSYMAIPIASVSAAKYHTAFFFLWAATVMAFFVFISVLSSGAISSADRLGHVLARLLFSVLMLCLILIGLASSKCSSSELRSMILMSYLVVLVLCLFDFAQLYGFSDVILPRASVETLEARFGGEYFRVRGPTVEPGHLAAFFAATLPLVVQWSRRPYVILWAIAMPVFAFTFSTAFVIWLFVFILLSIILDAFQSARKFNKLFLAFIRSALSIFLCLLTLVFISDITGLYSKFASTSYYSRIESYSLLGKLLDTPFSLLFGLGPGVYKEYGDVQPINFLLSTLFELGICGLAVIGIIFFYNLIYLMRGQYIFLSAGGVAYLVFFNSISNYWYPFYALPLFYVLFLPRNINAGQNPGRPNI